MKVIPTLIAVASTIHASNASFWLNTLAHGTKHWNVPNLKEAIQGRDSKAYFVGTTTDVYALIELGNDLSYFAKSETFWLNFILAMQINKENTASVCMQEITFFYSM